MKHIEKMLDRMPNSRRAVYVAVAVGVAALIGIIAWLVYAVRANSDALAHTAAIGRSRGQALGTANAQLQQNGLPTVKVSQDKATPGNTDVGPTTPSSTPKSGKQGIPGATGAQGEQGPGPTKAQVAQAVTDYCDSRNDCEGKPTQAQVAAAVLTFCDKHSNCQGPAGDTVTGPAGQDGEDATGKPGKDGKQGPGPSGAQVAAAVNAFCADGSCRGPKGDSIKGDPGKDGKDGKDGANGKDGKDGKDGATPIRSECDNGTAVFVLSNGDKIPSDIACTTVTTPPPTAPTSEPSSTATGTP